MDSRLRERVEALTGAALVEVRPVDRGYSGAGRWLLELTSGERLFAKVGSNATTTPWLRREANIYRTVRADFLPELRGWEDDPERPLLLLESLEHAVWPPPWTRERVERILEAFSRMHAGDHPAPPLEEVMPERPAGWSMVAEDPAAFLGLELVSAGWLEENLAALLELEASLDYSGDAFCHWDTRGDNMCLDGERVLFVDWNQACRANPRVDVGFWLPSLAAEGGPLPHELMPDAADVAASAAGYFAARAGLPVIPQAPRVREAQLMQLVPSLRWCVQAMELAPLDGPSVLPGD